MSQSGSYLQATRHPWSCVMFVLPLLLVYETGLQYLGTDNSQTLRNGADAWLRLGLARIGLKHCFWAPALLIGVLGLKITGQSFNLMTLGGLSLVIGMLVDDATVEIENINRNRNEGKPILRAILDGARQVALPGKGSFSVRPVRSARTG